MASSIILPYVPSISWDSSSPNTEANGIPAKFLLARLWPELQHCVLKHLSHVDYWTLFSLRLTSRALRDIATPIAYRTLQVNEALIRAAEHQDSDVLAPVAKYTRHVVLRNNLATGGVKRILAKIHKLESIIWHHVVDQASAGVVPSDFLDSQQMRRDGTKLYVEDAPIISFQGGMFNFYLEGIPPESVMSLKVARRIPSPATGVDFLRRFLITSPQLQTLDFDHHGFGTSFAFGDTEKMPALAHLSLRCYNWSHSTEQIRRHWDFSRMRSLKLVSVPTLNFFTSVPLSDLAGLHTLQVEGYSGYLQDRCKEATRLLYSFVKNHARALQVLNMSCHTRLFRPEALVKHRDSLRQLRFVDHVGFSDEERVCPTLPLVDLALLARELHRVHTLELDMDSRLCDAAEFLQTVCQFRSLHTLVLHVQTTIRPAEMAPAPGLDPDLESAKKAFRLLTEHRGRINADVSWRRITINVGGWKRHMVRRLSQRWRTQNERGVFAERCFVLERDDVRMGCFSVREELCDPICDSGIGRSSEDGEDSEDDEDDEAGDDYTSLGFL